MKDKDIKRTLFFYYIIKTDNALEIIDNNKTYFNALLISYFGEIIPKIQNKQDFLVFLQNEINNLMQESFKSTVTVVLDKTISTNLSSKNVGKKIEFILIKEGNKFNIKSIVFENIVRNI